jgi:integrase/recombinase XerD
MGKSVKFAGWENLGKMDVATLAARGQISYLSKAQVETFFAAIPREAHRDQLLFELIYRHGLRRQEAALIRLAWIQERIWIWRVKHSIPAAYPIHPRTRRLLWAWLSKRGQDSNPYLFTSRQSGGSPISPTTIYSRFRIYAEAAGIPSELQHPHILRHSIATHLLESGWDIVDVQDWLGHAEISSTLVYARITNKRREAKHAESLLSGSIAANNVS